jgi:hypothetical protein
MKDALTVNFTIPAAVPTGKYLFRVEHIGLHVAQYVLGSTFLPILECLKRNSS